MKELIDSIKNEALRAFVWRVINTFIAVVLPVLAGAILLYFSENDLPIAVSSFANMDLWNFAIGSVIITLLGSVGAGIGKVSRVTSGIKEEISDEG